MLFFWGMAKKNALLFALNISIVAFFPANSTNCMKKTF
jgi:hypothetical protein